MAGRQRDGYPTLVYVNHATDENYTWGKRFQRRKPDTVAQNIDEANHRCLFIDRKLAANRHSTFRRFDTYTLNEYAPDLRRRLGIHTRQSPSNQ